MAIQKYKKVENWNYLEDYLDSQIPAFSIVIDKVMSRTFCKCGKAYVGIKDRCDCGNPVTKTFDYYSVSRTAKFYHSFETDKYGNPSGEMQFYMDRLTFDLSDRSKLKFELEKILLFRVGKDYFIDEDLNSARYTTPYDNQMNLENYVLQNISKHPFYDSFKYWFELRLYSSENLIGLLKNVIQFPSSAPILYNDAQIKQYPYLAAYFIRKPGVYGINEELKTLYQKHIFNDEQYMDVVNYYFMKIKNTSSSVYHSNVTNILNTIKNFSDIKNTENVFYGKENLFNLINHYILNHMLSLDEAFNILNMLAAIINNPSNPRCFSYDYKYSHSYYHKNCDPFFEDFFDISYIDFFDTYLKENISIIEDKNKFVFDFIDRIRDMKDCSIPIKRDNFKIKNYNWNITNKKMAEFYKLPEDKVSLFLDMFEKNPLDSLELIENRRKLTPKQIDAIIDKLGK